MVIPLFFYFVFFLLIYPHERNFSEMNITNILLFSNFDQNDTCFDGALFFFFFLFVSMFFFIFILSLIMTYWNTFSKFSLSHHFFSSNESYLYSFSFIWYFKLFTSKLFCNYPIKLIIPKHLPTYIFFFLFCSSNYHLSNKYRTCYPLTPAYICTQIYFFRTRLYTHI